MSLASSLRSARPGDTITLPDGVIADSIELPLNLAGTAAAPISIVGGKGSTIRPSDRKAPALSGFGCKHIRLSGFRVEGGRIGVELGQSDDRYSSGGLIADVVVRDLVIVGAKKTGFKAAGGRSINLLHSFVEQGPSKGVELIGLRDSRVELCEAFGDKVAISLKSGCYHVLVYRNRISGHGIGVRFGSKSKPKRQAPWTDVEADECVARENTFAGISREALIADKTRSCINADNALAA